MKDFFKVLIMMAGVALGVLGLYVLTTKIAPVMVAYIGLAMAVGIILYAILLWKKK
jgi:hypothetical protein